jgi:hypothetical protein
MGKTQQRDEKSHGYQGKSGELHPKIHALNTLVQSPSTFAWIDIDVFLCRDGQNLPTLQRAPTQPGLLADNEDVRD